MIRRLLTFIIIHWMALAIAFGVGLVYACHHFFIPRFIDPQEGAYYPVTRADYFDEVLLYGPRAHSAFLDFGIRGDFSLAEYPKSPALLPILNPLLLGGFGKVFRRCCSAERSALCKVQCEYRSPVHRSPDVK